jgi:hypothetical protein
MNGKYLSGLEHLVITVRKSETYETTRSPLRMRQFGL